jgi:hypothetical protein
MGVKHGLLQMKFCVKPIFLILCLTYILIIWLPSYVSTKGLWEATENDDIHLYIRNINFEWIVYTLRKYDGEIPNAALQRNPQESRNIENQKTDAANRLSKKRGEAGRD